MQFTPQQLAGAGRFSQKTKIGNWCEDQSLTNAKLQDYLVRKAQGNLLTMEAKVRKDQLQRIVPLTHTSDGCLRFGDAVQLRSKRMGSTSAESRPHSMETANDQSAIAGRPQGTAPRGWMEREHY